MTIEQRVLEAFAAIAPALREAMHRANTPLLTHPSGVVAESDYRRASIFRDPTEVVGIDGLRLLSPHQGGGLPFSWMIKTTRTRCESSPHDEWTPLTIYFDVNQMLQEDERAEAERQALEAVARIGAIGVERWVAECSAALAGGARGSA
jgi:hypothetical protein